MDVPLDLFRLFERHLPRKTQETQTITADLITIESGGSAAATTEKTTSVQSSQRLHNKPGGGHGFENIICRSRGQQ